MKIQLNAAARLVESGFEDWPKERQQKYLKEHPGSKYGKGGGKAAPVKTVPTKPAPIKPTPAASFSGDLGKKHKIDLGEYVVRDGERSGEGYTDQKAVDSMSKDLIKQGFEQEDWGSDGTHYSKGDHSVTIKKTSDGDYRVTTFEPAPKKPLKRSKVRPSSLYD
jgi:hypothetical protein